jgi:hypothetical protein
MAGQGFEREEGAPRPSKSFERTVIQRGRPVLAMNCVLARAQLRSCAAVQGIVSRHEKRS